MENTYDLNQLAVMTGFTTRTLRSDLTSGALTGEKVDGAWQFTAEDIDAFMNQSAIRRRAAARQNSVVYDFLADAHKQANRLCVVLDLPVSLEESAEVQTFFCKQMNKAHDAQFYARMVRGLLRVTLSGAEDQIASILAEYYGWKNRTAEQDK